MKLAFPRTLPLTALLLLGCESSPVDGPDAPDVTWQVQVLDPWFVMFQGDRVPLDDFLWRMRQEGQRWTAEQTSSQDRIGIELIAATQHLSRNELDRVLNDLRLSGVQAIEIR